MPSALAAASSQIGVIGATRRIGGVAVAVADTGTALAFLGQRIAEARFTPVAFLNAHCVNLARERPDYRDSLAGTTVFPDGIGVDIASKLLYGAPFPANLNGTDFVPLLLASQTRPLRVALVGGEPGTEGGSGIAERAALRFADLAPQHDYVVVSDGFFRDGPETDAVLARLRSKRADILLVALGVPRQELFVSRHVAGAEASVAIGVGALFDFMAGKVPRAPRLVRKARLEWAYRLAIEPKRLFKRYVLGNPRFLGAVLAERLRRGRGDRVS